MCIRDRLQTAPPLPDGVETSGIETVNALNYELCHYEIPRQVQYLDTYAWRQKETHFALTTRALNVPNTKLHPVFRRQHPLFIAKGDPLQVLYCENDVIPELPKVRGIINHRDRQTYLIGGNRYFTEAGLNLCARVVFIFGAIVACFVLGMMVVDNADTPAGFHLDAWTLKRLGSELPPIILLLMLMVSGLALLIEGFAQICRLYSFDQHRTFKTFKYLRNLRRSLWRQAQVTELK